MTSKTESAILQAVSGSCKTLVDNTLRVTFDFEPRHASTAFKLFGERGTPAAIALLNNEDSINNDQLQPESENKTVPEKSKETEVKTLEKGEYGSYASALYSCGFFLAPNVWRACGTDKQFRGWIQRQPSAYSQNFSEWVNGDGRCVAAHVRRSNEAGVGIKPDYACIPLTHAEHSLQHQHGESALEDFDWDKARLKYIQNWSVERIREIFKVDSLTKIAPSEFLKWAHDEDLTKYLPAIFKIAS